MTEEEQECPAEVWFANQIPDFACASVALLNIVNNIKGLRMGKEMRDFKDFTNDLDPMARGDAIDGFDFLKHIHNSFARETDLLNADMHIRNKINKAKKRQAALQAQETKKAKKAANESKRADSAIATPARATQRIQRTMAKKSAKIKDEGENSDAFSVLSEPPDSDPEFKGAKKAKANSSSPPEKTPRRSGRAAKPRKDPTKLFSEAEEQPDEDGFHFVAYVPVSGRVWKMDGLNSFPHLVGDCDEDGGGLWTNVAGPDIQARMMMFEGVIQYNLMAVVHDPIVAAKAELAANVKELQIIDAKLDDVCNEWRSREGAETYQDTLVLGPDQSLDLADADLADVLPSTKFEKEIQGHQDTFVDELLRLRQQRIKAQAPLRGSVRDELLASKGDDEKVAMTRHDFGGFVKGWLGALAEQEELKGLVDAEL